MINPIYTDGYGTYYCPGNILAGNAPYQVVDVRNQEFHGPQQMLVTTVQANIGSGWTLAPNLTDLGGGVWVAGQLVDPTGSEI
jgi:hypothetical protein